MKLQLIKATSPQPTRTQLAQLQQTQEKLDIGERYDTYIQDLSTGALRNFSITPESLATGNSVNVLVTTGPVFFFAFKYDGKSGAEQPIVRIKSSSASPATFRTSLDIGDYLIIKKRSEGSKPSEVTEEEVVMYKLDNIKGNLVTFNITSRVSTKD